MAQSTNLDIQVCMGKSCQLKGSPLLAQAMRVELQKRSLAFHDAIVREVNAAYCQSICNEGIVVRIGSEIFTHVTVSDVPRLVNYYLQQTAISEK